MHIKDSMYTRAGVIRVDVAMPSIPSIAVAHHFCYIDKILIAHSFTNSMHGSFCCSKQQAKTPNGRCIAAKTELQRSRFSVFHVRMQMGWMQCTCFAEAKVLCFILQAHNFHKYNFPFILDKIKLLVGFCNFHWCLLNVEKEKDCGKFSIPKNTKAQSFKMECKISKTRQKNQKARIKNMDNKIKGNQRRDNVIKLTYFFILNKLFLPTLKLCAASYLLVALGVCCFVWQSSAVSTVSQSNLTAKWCGVTDADDEMVEWDSFCWWL